MSEQPPYPGTDDTDVRPEPRRAGMPLWVKVFLVIAVLLVLALVISSLAGVQHGPRMH